MTKITEVEIHEFTFDAVNLGNMTGADSLDAVGYSKGRGSENKTAPMQQIYPVSMGSVGSFAHSDMDASYTPTLVLPKRVKMNASLEAAIPPPQ